MCFVIQVLSVSAWLSSKTGLIGVRSGQVLVSRWNLRKCQPRRLAGFPRNQLAVSGAPNWIWVVFNQRGALFTCLCALSYAHFSFLSSQAVLSCGCDDIVGWKYENRSCRVFRKPLWFWCCGSSLGLFLSLSWSCHMREREKWEYLTAKSFIFNYIYKRGDDLCVRMHLY